MSIPGFRQMSLATTFILAAMVWTACHAERPLNTSRVPYDPNTMQYPLTPADAIACARSWLGQPDLELAVTKVLIYQGLPWKDCYMVDSVEQVWDRHYHCKYSFDVNCTTGRIREWRDNTPVQGTGERLADSEILAAAESFAASHFPGFTSKNMQLVDQGSHGGMWQEILPGGIRSMVNMVDSAVDVVTGAPVYYFELSEGTVTVPLTPSISAQEASETALQWIASVVRPELFVSVTSTPSLCVREDALSVQCLAWSISVAVSSSATLAPCDYPTDIYVNADTGQMISQISWLGSKTDAPAAQKPYMTPRRAGELRKAAVTNNRSSEPPQLLVNGGSAGTLIYPIYLSDGIPLLYSGYLSRGLGSAHINWLGGGRLEVCRNGRKYVLTCGSQQMMEGSTSHRLSVPPVNLHGRIYLPPDAVTRILNCSYTVDPTTHTLNLLISDFGSRKMVENMGKREKRD